ncbi:MAG: group I truncated hemoglobin [Thalassotalea sp.]
MRYKFLSLLTLLTALLITTGCATQKTSLYQAIGGQKTINTVVNNFIEEIQFNKAIYTYFAESNIDRFKEKMSEHLCLVTQGPCQYTGDSMLQVHSGMNINETDFNSTVDLLINAMTKAQVSHRHQNQILNHLAKFRKEIIYR